MKRRTFIGLAGVLAAIVGATVAAQVPAGEKPKRRVFALQTVEGKAFGSADLAGKPYLVFFGFTHCPDVCPTPLFELTALLKDIGPADAFSATYKKVQTGSDNYTMDHTAGLFLIRADGRLQGMLDMHEPRETQLQKLKLLAAS
jgi:protein SCO1/2